MNHLAKILLHLFVALFYYTRLIFSYAVVQKLLSGLFNGIARAICAPLFALRRRPMRLFMMIVAMAVAIVLFLERASEPGFAIKVKNEINHHAKYSVFVLPQEEVEIEALQTDASCKAWAEQGQLTAVSRNKWRYRAPATPGVSFLEIGKSKVSPKMRVGVWVMIPFTQMQGEYLNQYRIGKYPRRTPRRESYETPPGFIEVTAANQDIFLTPHFQLKQFLCRQKSVFPQYVVLRERLLLALEHIVQNLNESGFKVNTLGVLSGYRTPFYNSHNANKPFSRHMYGDAADVFLDRDQNGKMDDLDDDGDFDGTDAKIFHDLIDRVSRRTSYAPFTGGLGFYKKTEAHNGFVHIDTRGIKARW